VARGSCGRSYLVIVAEHHPQRSVLRLQGELDACGEARLRWAICAVVGDHPRPILEMDLSALTFADCAGLSVMVWAHKRLAEQGHELVITGARPLIRRLLRLTGLDDYLHLCPSEPDGGPDEFPRIQHLAPASRGHPVVREVAGSARKPPRSTL
jgi:anti-anti-sigma factor